MKTNGFESTLARGALLLLLSLSACGVRVLSKPSGAPTADKGYFYIIEDMEGEPSKVLKCDIAVDNRVRCSVEAR